MKGQVLLEASLAIFFLLLPSFFFHLELVRFSNYQVLMRHACFLYVRARSLGASETQSRKQIHLLGKALLPNARFEKFMKHLHTESWWASNALQARVQRRYTAGYTFLKRQIQITKTCRFSF